MGGREVGGIITCSRRTATWRTPRTAPRSPRCGGIESVPAAPGKTAVEMFEAAARGEIKALWIACTNPAQSMPDQALVRARFRALRVGRAAGSLRPHRHRALPTCCCRLRRGARSEARSPTASAASAASAPRSPPRQARRGPTEEIATGFARRLARRCCVRRAPTCLPTRPSRSGIRRTPRDDPRTRPRHHRPHLRAARRRRPAAMARFADGAPENQTRLYGDLRFATPTAERASSPRRTARRPNCATRATRSCSTPGGRATSGTA